MARANFLKEYTNSKGDETYIYEIVGLTDAEIASWTKFRKSQGFKAYLTDEKDVKATENPAEQVGNPKVFTNLIFPNANTIKAGVSANGDKAGKIWLKCAIESKAQKYAKQRGISFTEAFEFLASNYVPKSTPVTPVAQDADDDDDADLD